MKKQIKAHEERNVKAAGESEPSAPVPAYLLDRSVCFGFFFSVSRARNSSWEGGADVPSLFFFFLKNPASAKALSSAIKNKRAEKAARFSVPLPKVRGISEEEMFKVVATGKKTHKKGWKRVVTQPVSYTQFPPGSDVSPAKILVH